VGGCISPPKLPDQSASGGPPAQGPPLSPTAAAPSYPPATFKDAIQYAYDTQKNYSEWLDAQVRFNLGAGLAEIALAGAALGLGAVGGSSDAVAALGTAAGVTIAADQWVVGPPGKDPRYKAYANGITELQCVIDDAWGAVPKSPELRPSGEAPDQIDVINKNLAAEEKRVSDQRDVLLTVINNAATACAQDPAMMDARLSVAEATTAVQRAEAVRSALSAFPTEIVRAVHTIHWQAYTAAQTSFPDISTIKVTAVKGGTPSAAPAEKAFRKAVPLCHGDLLAGAATLASPVADLNGALAGLTLPKPGFSECVKAADTTSPTGTPNTGTSKSGATAPGGSIQNAAGTPLSIQPSTELYAKAGQSQSITINGGRQPLFLVPVDPGLQVTRGPASGTGATVIQLSLSGSATKGRLLVTDIIGEQTIVSLESISGQQ
jgi:hypothetical protein